VSCDQLLVVMDVDQLYSFLTANGIPHEVATILRGKNCLRTFTFLVLHVVNSRCYTVVVVCLLWHMNE
jgi:hypothetical protein